MKFESVMNFLDVYKKGQITSIVIRKPLPVYQGSEHTVVKEYKFSAVLDVKYDNLKVVAEKRALGEIPKVNQGLPWGTWVVPGTVIAHNQKQYLRVTPLKGKRGKPRYFVDSKESTEEVVRSMCKKSAFDKKEPVVMDICITNIKQIVWNGRIFS